MKSIKILGAGISGLAAAINLAKAGYKVEVFERNRDVGMRFGGDLQGLENWSEKEDVRESLKRMNIEINFDCDSFSKIFLSNGLVIREISLQKPAFYLVKRGNFSGSIDQGLKIQALESGVNIHFGKTIPPGEADIISTGPLKSETPAIAKGIVFKTASEDVSIGLLNYESAYKGYSYLLVTKGYGCMCSAVWGDSRRLNDCFEKAKEKFRKMKELDISDSKPVGCMGCFSLKNTFKEGKNLFVGEAAGLQDMLWGFGMRYAFTSAFLAA